MLAEQIVIRKWSGSHWEIALEHAALAIKTSGKIEYIPCDGTISLELKRRWLRWHLYTDNKSQLRLKGISRFEAKLLTISFQLSKSRLWSEKLQKVLMEHREQQRWVPQEIISELIATKPKFSYRKAIERQNFHSRLIHQEVQALSDLELNLESTFEELNQEILYAEITNQKQFLESIESNLLVM